MQRFKDILYVTIPDFVNGAALERAAALADNNHARLTVVEVIDKIPSNIKVLNRVISPDDLQEKIVAGHRQRLEELVAPWNRNIEIQSKVLIGIPFLEITREVLRNGRDLVIKTAESGGLLDRIFGSDDMHLLRKCPCPVWLVKSESHKAHHRILAAVDVNDYYSPEEVNTKHLLNIQTLEMAISLALSEFAELHIVHAWEDVITSAMRGTVMEMPKEADIVAYAAQVRQKHGQNLKVLMDETISKLGQNGLEYLNPKIHLLNGPAHKEIPALANEIEADLVIMGTVARTGIPGFFMGNTAEAILNHINCSVLAIKPLMFVTPITLED